jgi:hypothetical protein
VGPNLYFFNNGYSNSARASTIKPFTGVINTVAYKTTVIAIPSDSLPQSDVCGKARSQPLGWGQICCYLQWIQQLSKNLYYKTFHGRNSHHSLCNYSVIPSDFLL